MTYKLARNELSGKCTPECIPCESIIGRFRDYQSDLHGLAHEKGSPVPRLALNWHERVIFVWHLNCIKCVVNVALVGFIFQITRFLSRHSGAESRKAKRWIFHGLQPHFLKDEVKDTAGNEYRQNQPLQDACRIVFHVLLAFV